MMWTNIDNGRHNLIKITYHLYQLLKALQQINKVKYLDLMWSPELLLKSI